MASFTPLAILAAIFEAPESGSGGKENKLAFFRKLALLKSKINRYFLFLSLLEHLVQGNLDASFLGKL